jgi:hypothetical protein
VGLARGMGVGILIQLLQSTVRGHAFLYRFRRIPRVDMQPKFALRPDSSVVERGPEKAGVGGSIPSLATTIFPFRINNLN